MYTNKRKEFYKDRDVRLLLSWMLEHEDEKVVPIWEKNKCGFNYPVVSKIISVENVRSFLEKLVSHGLLKKNLFSSELVCPKCESINLHDRYICPLCGSSKLQKGELIEHYGCGFVEFADKFSQGNELICPKCEKPLKLIGTDYRRIENIFRCLECNNDSSVIKITHICNSCGNSSSDSEIVLRPIYAYEFNIDMKNEVSNYCMVQTPIVDLFKDSGFSVETPKILTGNSGIKHTFDIYAFKDGEEIVMDIVKGEERIEYSEVLKFHTKIYDVQPREASLVAIPGLTSQALMLTELYKINIVDGENMEEINKKIQSLTSKVSPIKEEKPSTGISTRKAVSPREKESHLIEVSTKKTVSPRKRKAPITETSANKESINDNFKREQIKVSSPEPSCEKKDFTHNINFCDQCGIRVESFNYGICIECGAKLLKPI